MNLDSTSHGVVAHVLVTAANSADPIDTLRDRYPLTDADAAEIRRRVVDKLRETRGEVAGYAVSFAGPDAEAVPAADGPVAGRLFEGTTYRDGGVPTDRLIAPRVAPELVVELDGEVPHGATRTETLDAVAAVTPAVRVADCHIRDWDVDTHEATADNGLVGGVVLGSPSDPAGVDLAGESVAISHDGKTAAEGTAESTLGDPVDALQWLAARLAEQEDGLVAGDRVATGPMTALVPVESGDRVVAAFDSLGEVAATFD